MAALLELLPQLVLGLALLSAVLSYGSARGLIFMWDATFGRMLEGIARFMNWSVTILGHRVGFDFGGPFRAANNGVQNWLKAWARGAEIEIAWTLKAMSATWAAGVYAAEWLARETALSFDWLARVRVPKVIRYAVPLTLTPLLLARLLKAVLPHIHAVVNRPVHIIYRTIPQAATRAATKVITETYRLPARVAALPREITGLTKRNLRLALRLRRVEALLGATAMAVAMANVWGVSFRCVRSSGPIGKLMRHLCGLDSWLVRLLTAGVVEAFVVSDLCAFSSLLQAQAKLIRPALLELVSVEDALVGCHGTTKPQAISLPDADLPPLQGVSPLAA